MSVSQLLKYRYTSVFFFCLLCQLSMAIVTMWLHSPLLSLLTDRSPENRPTWRDCITAVMFMLSVIPVIAITILMAVLAKMARMAPLAIMAVIAVMAVMAFLITWTCLKGLVS